MTKMRWFRAGDLIPIGLVLAAIIAVGIGCMNAAAGQRLRVETPSEELVF